MKTKEVFELIIRYLLLIVLAIPNLFILYAIFTPLTIKPISFLLTIFTRADITGDLILFDNFTIQLIPACIAGSAYYLLLVLNLSTPMKLKTRLNSIVFLLLSFLILNIIRILLFTALAFFGFQYFGFAHEIAWYFGSTLLIIIIWFVNVKLFKIKEIPVYSDVSSLFSQIKTTKKKHK